jgi:hypothetical protein
VSGREIIAIFGVDTMTVAVCQADGTRLVDFRREGENCRHGWTEVMETIYGEEYADGFRRLEHRKIDNLSYIAFRPSKP